MSEVMVNGPDRVYVERGGKIERTPTRFIDETHLRRVIDKIVGEVSRRVDESSPMVDARLPDGSRINAVIHPLAIGGPFLTVRKFAKEPAPGRGPRHQPDLHLDPGPLHRGVRGRAPEHRRVRWYRRRQDHDAQRPVVASSPTTSASSPSRTPRNSSSARSTSSRWNRAPPTSRARARSRSATWCATALRMRPDRIIVGECRGGEALDMLQAMNTGHEGSLTTIHSNSPRDTLSRIETMTLMAGFDLPIRVIREQMSSAIDLIVHLTRLRDGTRRVTHVVRGPAHGGRRHHHAGPLHVRLLHGHRRGRQLPGHRSSRWASAPSSPTSSRTPA